MCPAQYGYQFYDAFHAARPDTPFISSESCSCTSDRNLGVNASAAHIGVAHAWPCLKDCWQPVATRSWVQGSFDWTGFDYRGEETPTRWPSTNSHFGILDLAGFKKDAAYYYQAQFNPHEPTVHIAPGSWEHAAPAVPANLSVLSTPCTDGNQRQRWRFDAATHGNDTGSALESIGQPGQCLNFSTAYPAGVVPCRSGDPRQQFEWVGQSDGSHAVVHRHSDGVAYCLDVYGQVGPSIGFWRCSPANPAPNQRFSFVSGALREMQTAPTNLSADCATLQSSDAVEVSVSPPRFAPSPPRADNPFPGVHQRRRGRDASPPRPRCCRGAPDQPCTAGCSTA